MVSDRPLRLGVVSYLNAVPLVHGLEADPRFTLVRDVPSRIAELLHAGEVDLGMIPSVEYAAGEYAIVRGCDVAEFSPDGFIRSNHVYWDSATVARQIGVGGVFQTGESEEAVLSCVDTIT